MNDSFDLKSRATAQSSLFGVPFTLVAVTMLLLATTAEWKPYGPALIQKAESRVPLLGRLRSWLRPDGSGQDAGRLRTAYNDRPNSTP